MCRLFALHAGRTTVDATFWLLEAPTSLLAQSHRNPDGYGLGTFEPDGSVDIDKGPAAAWADARFAQEARTECSTTFLAHVRYASVGALTDENTHPFTMDGRIFGHNGVVGDLDRIEAELSDEVRGMVLGDTDSERLFALITQRIRDAGGDVRAGIVDATRWLAEHVALYSLNFVMTTAEDVWALRYPEGNELFVLQREPGGPRACRHLDESSPYGTIRVRADEGLDRPLVVVASERMDEDPGWTPVEPGELVHVGPDLRVTRELILPDAPVRLMELTGRAADSQAQEEPVGA
jgi:predicted glutamine amidotransferase